MLNSSMSPFEPMLLGRTDTPPGNPGWSFEMKWDGWRTVLEITRRGTRIWSRNGHDVTHQFPELHKVHQIISPCVIDAELVVLDEAGHPRFEWMHRRRRPDAT